MVAGTAAASMLGFLGFMMPKLKPSLRYKSPTKLYERFPVERIREDGLCVTKDGKFVRLLRIEGRNYMSMDQDETRSLFYKRKQWLENLPTEVTALVQSHRNQISREAEEVTAKNELASEVMSRWNHHFTSNYRTTHFVFLIADAEGLLDAVEKTFSKVTNKGEQNDIRMLQALQEAVNQTKDRLGDQYVVEELQGDDVFSYFATILSGRPKYVRRSKSGFVDGVLSGTDLHWPNGKKHQVYDNVDKMYSSWLSIQAPAEWSTAECLNDLFRIEGQFSVYQSINRIDKQLSLAKLEDYKNNAAKFRFSPEGVMDELYELQQRIEGGDISLHSHRLAIEVYGEDLEELKEHLRLIKRRVERDGYIIKEESLNQELCFWSKFPGSHTLNPRVQYPSSDNLSHFVAFPARVKGLNRCSFGNQPFCRFKTLDGDEYSFVPHETSAPQALGNILIVGGAGKGKTTLINWLVMNCLKYPGFRGISFDRLFGMEVFTKLFGGTYYTGDDLDKVGLNPLQLDNTSSNRAFLSNWLHLLVGAGQMGGEARKVLSEAISQTYDIDRQFRTLCHFSKAVGIAGQELRDSFDPWIKGGEFGGFFSSEEDSLSFDNPLVTFDMTTLLDLEDVLAPFLYYVFHKITTEASGDPFMLFVDEAPRFFKAEKFLPYGQMILDELRKKNGVGVFAGQNASAFLNTPFAESFQKNVATYIFFPDAKADPGAYMGELGLNDREFGFVKNFQPSGRNRAVLVKRSSGESVILNVDLSPLGPYLKAFDSSSSAVKRIRNLQQTNPEGFRREFIFGESA